MKHAVNFHQYLFAGVFRSQVRLLLGCLLLPLATAFSQTSADPELLAEIQKIKAIDNHSHAHPARGPKPSEAGRPDPLGKTPFDYPVRLRVTNPEYIEAWNALYGYKHKDMAAEHVREALKTKLRLMEEKGMDYPSWIMD